MLINYKVFIKSAVKFRNECLMYINSISTINIMFNSTFFKYIKVTNVQRNCTMFF